MPLFQVCLQLILKEHKLIFASHRTLRLSGLDYSAWSGITKLPWSHSTIITRQPKLSFWFKLIYIFNAGLEAIWLHTWVLQCGPRRGGSPEGGLSPQAWAHRVNHVSLQVCEIEFDEVRSSCWRYLYRATEDPWLLEAGLDILRSIQHSTRFFVKYKTKHWTTFPTRTPCGYATVKNVRDHSLADRMESFFLAETTKYLYLLFDPNNFLHNKVSSKKKTIWSWIISWASKVSILFHQFGLTQGNTAEVVKVEGQGRCMLDAGGYIFNTEAHPIDPAALACCSGLSEDEVISAMRLSWPPKFMRVLPG